MEAEYTAVVTAKGGRDGHIRSSDGILDTDLIKPEAMGGHGGNYTNPEQLFAGAWGACYLGALGTLAKRDNIDISNASVDVHVIFNKDGNAYALSAEMHVKIPGLALEEAQLLAEKAHRVCPYSKATRGNVETKVIAE